MLPNVLTSWLSGVWSPVAHNMLCFTFLAKSHYHIADFMTPINHLSALMQYKVDAVFFFFF